MGLNFKYNNLLTNIINRDSSGFKDVIVVKETMGWLTKKHKDNLEKEFRGIKLSKVTHPSYKVVLMRIQWKSRVGGGPRIKYLRLLTYSDATKVLRFIIANDPDDKSYVVAGGLAMQVKERNWNIVYNYIQSISTKFEIGEEHPSSVVKKIIKTYRE
jgi:hypothetical protein